MPDHPDSPTGRAPDWSAAEAGAGAAIDSDAEAGEGIDSGAGVQVADAAPVPLEDLSPIMGSIVTSTVEILCPAWGITPEEISQLAAAYGAVANKYLPAFVGRYGLEINAALVTLVIIGPHIGQPRHESPSSQDDQSPTP